MADGVEVKKKKKKVGLTSKIFLGLILGALFGAVFPQYGEMIKPIGDMFIG